MQTPQRQSPGTQSRQYCFGDFILDLEHGFLFRRGEEVPLRPKSLEVLAYLVERHGRLVGKEELIAAVWADTATTDNSLAQCLLEIRRALGDDSQQFIRTVPRRGYVFNSPITAPVSERPVLAETALVRRKATFVPLVLALIALAATASWLVWRERSIPAPAHLEFTQLTNFPDSVHSPALSKDGKMLLFIRGSNHGWVGEPGEIYLKLLPNGETLPVTQDGKLKMAPTFMPEEPQIVYTSEHWASFSIPITGGTPALFMANASGITWIGPKRILFSEIKDSPRMAVVTASEERGDERDVYVPASRQGMAHFSYLSPDKKWVLVVEMLTNVGWIQCRVVPFNGSSRGKPVGPPGSSCTAAAWSPDGRWMYFAARVQGESHLWRQRFPDGAPEQLTSGLNEEQGVVADPNGQSLITAVVSSQSTVWYHDESGDRPVSVEGYAYRPQVTDGGAKVYYLVRRGTKASFPIGELWSMDLASGRNERVLPDFLVRFFQVSRNGRQVVFDSFDPQGRSRLWLASTDGSEPPRKLTPDGEIEEERAFFGASGDIFFMRERPPDMAYVYRMKPDGSHRRQLFGPITFLVNISPDEKWAVLWSPGGTSVLPLAGGPPQVLWPLGTGPIFPDPPRISWSGDGKFLFVPVNAPSSASAATNVIPWRGVPPADVTAAAIRKVPEMGLAPGPSGTVYAFTRRTQQSNLYRVRFR